MKVYSLEEARDWFLQNREDGVICVREDGIEEFCKTYNDADFFYS